MELVLWTLAIAMLTAILCSLCGVLLLVNREAMLSEALSHAVLPGIIVAFLLTGDRSSPWLIIGAGLTGVVMILIARSVARAGTVNGEAALGIAFSALFSIGVILASLHLAGVHFHAECIVDGNLSTAPLNTIVIGGKSIGPRSFYVIAATLAAVVTFISLFYKELKIALFDGALSQSFGYRPAMLKLVWLILVSLSTVAVFEVAGSVLVVALMIAPPAAALLLSRRLSQMLVIAPIISGLASLGGFAIGYQLDVSPTGPIAAAAGLAFLIVFALAPSQGVLARVQRRRQQRVELFEHLVLTRLQTPRILDEAVADIEWSAAQRAAAIRACRRRRWIVDAGSTCCVTPAGIDAMRQLGR